MTTGNDVRIAQIDFNHAKTIYDTTVAKIPANLRTKDFAVLAAAAGVYAAAQKLVIVSRQGVADQLQTAREQAAASAAALDSWEKLKAQLPSFTADLAGWKKLAGK